MKGLQVRGGCGMSWDLNNRINWKAIPAALAMVVAIATSAYGQVQTPLQTETVVRGTSGGTQASACGFIAGRPSQTVRVTEAFTRLRFRVQGGGSSTLLILGGDGSVKGCARADNFSNGNIETAGAWERGTYSLYVGEQERGNSSPFTLSIVQN